MANTRTEAVAVMTTALKGTIALFGKDQDLDRNDLLGEIDLGAARQLMRTARVAAAAVLEDAARSGEIPVAETALRRVARLIACDTFVMDEARADVLKSLVGAAEQVEEAHMQFEARFDEAELAFSGARRGGRD